jgi:very-short-patch-repair endonuclease
MRLANVACGICGRIWREPSQRMREGKTCGKICSSIKGYLSGDRKETRIELKLQEILTELNITFETQKPLLGVTIADIFIYPNVAIFADGEYWHSEEGKKIRDNQKTKKLEKHHYIVLRLLESDINNNPEKIKTELITAYGKRKAEKKL